jgi:hypothetical protein
MGLINEIGNIYGYLTVIERAPNNKDGRAMWKCKCKCGNEVIVLGKHLRSGNTKSCGCYQKERAAESNLKRGGDLTGKRFGKLVVLEEAGFIEKDDGRKSRLWRCQCDCGNICSVQHVYLACGDTKSCGCINSVGNMTINRLLNLSGHKYKTEYWFKDFICNTRPYQFDFALLNENNQLLGLIEYQGDIHFTYRENGWNTKESFEERVKRDKIKFDYCKKNNIKLYYITYLEDIEERLEEITSELYSK